MVVLKERTREQVKIYFNKVQDEEIKKMIPMSSETMDDALQLYDESISENSTSYGETIYVDDKYIGDIWCYCINHEEIPNAMLSYCIFDKGYWNKGICTEAVEKFISHIESKFCIDSIGAFTYADNISSIAVLNKNNFINKEIFDEDGVKSYYFERVL